MASEDSDRVLVERLRRGDKAACAECIERHSPGVYRVALRLTGNEAEAEDVVQETFLSAFKAIDKFEGRSGLATWLYRIAHNAALMRLRRVRPDQVSVDDEEVFGEGLPVPAHCTIGAACPNAILNRAKRAPKWNGRSMLAGELRVVFVMRELEGLSTEETAEALDVFDRRGESPLASRAVATARTVVDVLCRTGPGGGVTWQQPNASICWRTCPTTSTAKRRRNCAPRSNVTWTAATIAVWWSTRCARRFRCITNCRSRSFRGPLAAVQIARSQRVSSLEVEPHPRPPLPKSAL